MVRVRAFSVMWVQVKFCDQVQTAWLNNNTLETLEKENEIFIEVRYQLLTGVITFQAVIYGLSEDIV